MNAGEPSEPGGGREEVRARRRSLLPELERHSRAARGSLAPDLVEV